jgi:predicted O-methyltransferase YrrM
MTIPAAVPSWGGRGELRRFADHGEAFPPGPGHRRRSLAPSSQLDHKEDVVLTTLRRRRFAVGAGGLILAVAVAAAVGWGQLALIGMTGLLAMVLLGLARIRATLREARARERDLIKQVQRLSTGITQRIDAAGTRILAAVEGARLEAIDRERAALGGHWDQSREVEALIQLFQRIKPRAAMPSSGQWALDPTGLLQLVSLIERHRPAVVTELGSGTSTIWIGYALEQVGGGRLMTLEHQPDFAERTRALVDIHGLDKLVEVRDAPLTKIQLGDSTTPWYALDALVDLQEIDLLVVDGPPGSVGRRARYPALPVLVDRLADGAIVVLDDVERADETSIVERWCAEIPGLTRTVGILGGQAILTYRR